MFKIKAELFLKTVLGYVVILVALFFVAWLTNKLINTAIILASYSFTRWVFPITYHAKTSNGCLLFSIVCFSIAIIIVLPIQLSIISSVGMGAIISALLYYIQYFIELKEKPILSEREIIIDKCRALKYNQLKTEIAIKFFVENEKPKEVWEWLCNDKHEYIEWDSVKQLKWRMKKELFK